MILWSSRILEIIIIKQICKIIYSTIFLFFQFWFVNISIFVLTNVTYVEYYANYTTFAFEIVQYVFNTHGRHWNNYRYTSDFFFFFIWHQVLNSLLDSEQSAMRFDVKIGIQMKVRNVWYLKTLHRRSQSEYLF